MRLHLVFGAQAQRSRLGDDRHAGIGFHQSRHRVEAVQQYAVLGLQPGVAYVFLQEVDQRAAVNAEQRKLDDLVQLGTGDGAKRVAVGEHHREVVGGKQHGVEPAQIFIAGDQGHIRFVVEHTLDRLPGVAWIDVDVHVAVPAQQRDHQIRDDLRDRSGIRQDTQAGHALGLFAGEVRAGQFVLVDDPPSVHQQSFACGGQRQAAGLTVEQPGAKLFFERTQPCTGRRE